MYLPSPRASRRAGLQAAVRGSSNAQCCRMISPSGLILVKSNLQLPLPVIVTESALEAQSCLQMKAGDELSAALGNSENTRDRLACWDRTVTGRGPAGR